MQALIELHNVTAYRGDTRVFDGFSLQLIQGRNTVILGPNGAGKTTLLKLLVRDVYPVHSDDSYVRVLGQAHGNVWELRSQLGIVSHDLQQDYVGFARGKDVILSGFHSSIGTWAHQEFSAEQRERADHVMEFLGVIDRQEKMYAAMSTGEQRRFLLGRALVNDPNTLVLDEPTSGLDLKACFQYLDILRGLMQRGKTVVLVTHHIHEIPPEISHVVLLKDGKVFAQGEKGSVLTSARLTELFDTPVALAQVNGFYQAMPGA